MSNTYNKNTIRNEKHKKMILIFNINYKIQDQKMSEGLKWLLITSITLVSTTLLMFVTAYIAIFNETAQYYETTVSNIVLLSNTFNIFYLIVSPIIFSWLKKHYSVIVMIATVCVAIGCVGRYLVGDNYNLALGFSILVAISHVPIITAPYGLLGMFQPSKRGYASSIPLFVPALGINFCIFYGMLNITSQFPGEDTPQKQKHIERLNFIIAVVSVVSTICTLILMSKLKKQIRQINEDSDDGKKDTRSCIQQIKSQFSGDYKPFLITVISWGTILGMHWTYGGMFGIFLDNTGLTRFQIALVGLFANLSSAVFCNLGNWISNAYKYSNISIIFYLNIFGFLGSLYLQASSALPYSFFQNREGIILAVIVLRAGFSSFVSLALMELNRFGPSVLVSSIFFYVANATNLGGNYLVDLLSNPQSLAVMSALIWLSIFCVHMVQRSKINAPSGAVQVFSDDMISRKDQQQMTQIKSQVSVEGNQV